MDTHTQPTAPWGHLLPGSDTPLPDRADVVVVGGGWPGLVAATTLARSGASVVLVEARHRLGDGASGRAPGLATPGLVEHPWRLANGLGDVKTRALFEVTTRGLHQVRALAPPAHTGVAWAAVDDREPADITRSAAWLGAAGHPVEHLDGAGLDARLGSQHLTDGWFDPAGLVLDPVAITTALVQEAIAAGVTLVTDTRVLDLDGSHDSLAFTTSAGIVQADAAVLAAEAGMAALDAWLAEMFSPVREQALWLTGAPCALSHGLRAGFGYTWYRPWNDGLVVGGARWATPHMEVGEHDDTQVTARVQERLEASARRFFPDGPAQVSHRWSWITASSCDGIPLVGPLPSNPRIAVCAGFQGLEATLGIASGLAVAEGLLTGSPAWLPDWLAPVRLL